MALGDYVRGQVIDLSVIFVSNVTGQLIDPISPTVEIVHYDGNDEIIDLPATPLNKVPQHPVGHYTLEYTIPATFELNERYFVRWTGEDPNTCTPGTRDIVEDHFRIVEPNGSSSGGCCCLVPRFTTC